MWIGIGVGLLVLIVLVILLIAFLTRKKWRIIQPQISEWTPSPYPRQPVRKPEFAEREDNTYIDDVDPVMLTNPLYEQTQSPRNSKINIEISIGESGQVTTNGMSMPTGKSISSMRLSGGTTNPGYEMMSIRKENDRQSPNQDYEMMGMNGSDKQSTLKSDYSVPRTGSELSGTESEYDTPKVQPDYDTPRYLGRLLPAPPAYSKDKPKDPWDIQVVEGWNAQSKI
ncbi:unnamed protein product [Owenia fusiformis]|uniref:Uncharacterized protein n=1 Tax=Owenia fusiformis TaxID=6347 RepID=A0A8S4MUW9_OWEFU|nr:unnamed protein product [Owenia fusiformis]